MSKKKNEKGPTVEESLAKLQSKLTEFEGKTEKKSKDHLAFQSNPSKHLLVKPTSHSVFMPLENINIT